MNTNSEFFKKGHDLGSGGHAAGLAPQGMTSEQNKDFRDGYMVGQSKLIQGAGRRYTGSVYMRRSTDS